MFPVKGIGKVRSPQALLLRNYLRIGDALFAAPVKKLSDPCRKLRRKVHPNPFDTWVFHNRQDCGSFLVEVFNLFLSFRNKKDER
jgi:hypothetical protein